MYEIKSRAKISVITVVNLQPKFSEPVAQPEQGKTYKS